MTHGESNGHVHSSRIRILRFFENPKKRDFLRFLKWRFKTRKKRNAKFSSFRIHTLYKNG